MTKPYIQKDTYATHYYKDEACTIHHREDGPAVQRADGTKVWYLNGRLHREDGPAIEYSNGTKQWLFNGILHRLDGPALENTDGYKFWWLNGKNYSEEEHKRIIKLWMFK